MKSKTRPFKQVTIVGLGLIGGSLGMALKRHGVARQVVGVARRASVLREARLKKAIDLGTTRLGEGVDGADLVVLATPPASVVKLAQQVARTATGPVVITDVASTKEWIVRQLKGLPKGVVFVGGHPMAGSEKGGISAACGTLFDGASCILTKAPGATPKALSQVARLWRGAGSQVVVTTPKQHDAWVAQISHLPHLAASALTLSVSDAALSQASTGFASTTRLALGDPKLWEEICRTNPREIDQALGLFIQQLNRFRREVRSKNRNALRRRLKSAQSRRQKL